MEAKKEKRCPLGMECEDCKWYISMTVQQSGVKHEENVCILKAVLMSMASIMSIMQSANIVPPLGKLR